MLEWLFMKEIDIEKYEFNDIYFNLISGFFSGEIKNTGRLLARFAISCFKPLMREGLFDVGQCGCF